jgi:hypothetical protein
VNDLFGEALQSRGLVWIGAGTVGAPAVPRTPDEYRDTLLNVVTILGMLLKTRSKARV